MNIRLQGILLDGYGEPLPNASIAFRAKRTTDVVLGCTVAQARADKYGRYDITVEGGYYSLIINGHEYLKGVLIDDNLTVSDLNELILQGTTEDNVDSVIVEFREIQAEVEAALAEAEQRVGSSQELLDARDTAVQSANSASASATSAAEDAALVEALADTVAEPTATYTSVSAALSATADGDYFRVIAAPSAALVEVYRNDGGSATLITTYYTKDGVDQTNEQITRLNRSFSLKPYTRESLRSDFVNQAYGLGDVSGISRAVGANEIFTVERSTSKWVFGPQGKLVEVPPDTIAYHHDPVTGEALGALIEGKATNLFSFSEDFAQWNGDGESITHDGPESPIPGVGYKRLTAVDGNVQVYLSVSKEAGKSYVQSIYFKPGSGSKINLRSYQPSAGVTFDATTRTFSGSYGYVASSYQELPDGSFRVWAVLAPDETISGGNTGFRLDYYGEPVDAFLFGAQIEEGTAPTSYIPTDGAPVTRGEDVVRRALGNEAKGASGWTVLVEYSEVEITDNAFIASVVCLTDTPNQAVGNYIAIESQPTPRIRSSISGYDSLSLHSVSYNGGPFRAALSVSENETVLAAQGQSDSTSTSSIIGYPLSAFSHLLPYRAGRDERCNGGLELVKIFPRAMSATELEELTS